MSKHIPVLLNETIEGLNINPDGVYVDLTLGRGGHSKEILKRLKNGRLIAFDKDETAIEESKKNLEAFSSKFTGIHDDFRNFRSHLDELKIEKIDGIMADLGVSSPQFDDAKRGFSYKENARLDMRMDKRQKFSAYELINEYSLKDLTRVFREYGEDKYSYQIAQKIVKVREEKPIETTTELVDVIKSCKPQKALAKKENVDILYSELIGLMPKEATLDIDFEEIKLKDFDLNKQVIEYRIKSLEEGKNEF